MANTEIMNNWLSGQFCEVQVLEVRDASATNAKGEAFMYQEKLVRFPDGAEEWVPAEMLDDAHEPGFVAWTGEGVWAT